MHIDIYSVSLVSKGADKNVSHKEHHSWSSLKTASATTFEGYIIFVKY